MAVGDPHDLLDVLKPLAFPQEAFDFVNARFISPFMPKDAWPRLWRTNDEAEL